MVKRLQIMELLFASFFYTTVGAVSKESFFHKLSLEGKRRRKYCNDCDENIISKGPAEPSCGCKHDDARKLSDSTYDYYYGSYYYGDYYKEKGSCFDLEIMEEDGTTQRFPKTRYCVHFPDNYDPNDVNNEPLPLLVYLHGWKQTSAALPASAVTHAKENGYIVVAPTGFEKSWNGARTAKLYNCPSDSAQDHYSEYSEEDCDAGVGMSACADVQGHGEWVPCYDSCLEILDEGECPKENDNFWEYDGNYTCYWTTCYDSVAQIVALLDEMEERYCLNRNMLWVTGCSNGGIMVNELARDPRTSRRFAGFLPQVAGPMAGFAFPSGSDPSPFYMGFWGEKDGTVPGIADFPEDDPQYAKDIWYEGFLYTPADTVGEMWASLTGASKITSNDFHVDISDYSDEVECDVWEKGNAGDESEIVTCFFRGGHDCPGFEGMEDMQWKFAVRHPTTADPAECT